MPLKDPIKRKAYQASPAIREHNRLAMRKWRAENPEKAKAYARKWWRENPDKLDAYSRKRQGMSEPTRKMPAVCESCGQIETWKGKKLSRDHCHKTGQFRGWLCMKCNTALGKLGDDLSGVIKLVNYLVNYYTFSESNTL